ncbi:unnamed protein product [Amoebophrya sp. A120]|nr:unnamed protein product [Amoebophrya sp. A120]|eukprot:GSA120T00002330001.1
MGGERVPGVVKWFNLEKGYGFIEVTKGRKAGIDVFVHSVDVEGRPLMENDKVEMEVVEDERARNGKERALMVTGGTGDHDARERAKGRGKRGDSRRRGRNDSRGRGRGRRDSRSRSPKGKGKGKQSMKPGDWICDSCDFMNFAARQECMRCGKPKGQGGRFQARADSRPRGGDRSRSRSRGGDRDRGSKKEDRAGSKRDRSRSKSDSRRR